MSPTLFLRVIALSGVLCLGACATTAPAPESSQTSADRPTPPVAAQRPHVVESPAGSRNDEYYWLRDDTRSNPEVLEYLNAENAYKEAMLAHVQDAEDALYDEIVGRIKQDDATVPALQNGWWYYVRYETGKEYPIHARKQGSLEAAEQVLLDGNAMAQGHAFFSYGGYQVSKDNNMLAYTTDTVGRRQFVLHFRDLRTGQDSAETISNIEGGSLAFANDNRTVLYVEKHPETLLAFRVRKHVIGTDPALDPVVYEEADNTFSVYLWKSHSHRYINITSHNTLATEQRVADAEDPALAFRVLLPRERDHEYSAQDLGDRWLIRTNYQAKNFRVVEAPAATVGDRSTWKDVLAHRDDAFVQAVAVFKDFAAVNERSGGLMRIRIVRYADGAQWSIDASDPAYTMRLGDNREPSSNTLRYVYSSMTTPDTVYDYDVGSRNSTLMKRNPVLGDFDPANYASEFLWATARDGEKIPVSIVYRKGFKRDGSAALYQYGYGSYGASMDPYFSSQRLSLLDRGVVFAIAHVRGGQELGRRWYEGGKLFNKVNTFTDFIDVTDFLVREGYAAPDRVAAAGGSAGGLLMGAITNMAPEKYHAIVAGVPFVDVITTMLDESIPLTTGEFDEWCNPKQKACYDYMLTYSPYDNVGAKDYPAMLVTTGLWDSQVQYYEPAKWVARLRAKRTDNDPILLHTDMRAGHGGKSGRFERYRQTAMEFAFVLDQLGIEMDAATGAKTSGHGAR